MPEGDTILRAATRMHGALAGRTVTAFRSRLPALALAARRLLVRFSTGAALHSHMGMTGSWHLYRIGSRWRKSEALARVVLEAGEAAHPSLTRLGPDVLAPARDPAPAVAGLRARGEDEIGAAILDQTALSGVGNIYKSESLFLAGVDPFLRVAALDDATLTRIVRTAMCEMHRSVREGTGAVDGQARGRYWVYRRSGQPCRRCGTSITMARQGPMRRSTYWCPRCQPVVRA